MAEHEITIKILGYTGFKDNLLRLLPEKMRAVLIAKRTPYPVLNVLFVDSGHCFKVEKGKATRVEAPQFPPGV